MRTRMLAAVDPVIVVVPQRFGIWSGCVVSVQAPELRATPGTSTAESTASETAIAIRGALNATLPLPTDVHVHLQSGGNVV